jgi:uncharacterized protein (DUF58 family)
MFQDKFNVHRSFYLNRSFYYLGFAASVVFALSYLLPFLFTIGMVLLLCMLLATVVDAILLYSKTGIDAYRITDDRFSMGDDNMVVIQLENAYPFRADLTIVDEIPVQFQDRNWKRRLLLNGGEETKLTYTLKPLERGVYAFGSINVFVNGALRLVSRRYSFEQPQQVKVYPSYMQMRRFQLLATAHRLQEAGVKKLRRLGHSLEFEQIKEYVRGEDYRTINWKATARRGDLMVNNYTDQRSQQIYCIIDKGRVMKMPFEGLTLLDYSINASLVLANVALLRQDKAGLITYAQTVDSFIPADKKPAQLNRILETLYNQTTGFLESDPEDLFRIIRNRITHRSLLVLFTNFESMESLDREMPSLKKIAHYHLLVIIFFENTELKKLTGKKAATTEDVYIRTIAEKYQHEKRLMVKELRKQGIIALLSPPQHVTINTINKYLELKNRQSI